MTDTRLNSIRNFTIIAHIDHGKSTLADRLIEKCGTVKVRHMQEQMLDSMSIERERGITIKSQTVLLKYNSSVHGEITFNVIDTPGHVDFSYEVSRSLMACEGSLLVIDATQGVEAQTLANLYKAIESGHEILTVFNKVDLASADVEGVKKQLEDILEQELPHSVEISAKTGFGLENLLEKMVEVLPPPSGDINGTLKALVIDSWYDNYLGIIVLIRVKDGVIRPGMRIKIISTGATYEVNQVGVFLPGTQARDHLGAGEVGFCTASIKNLEETRVGDTITEDFKNNNVQPFPGFSKSVPMVFCGIFASNKFNFEEAKKCMAKLQLNDPSFFYTVERSNAFGMGFRCGFLGLLHMEIIRERLKREFDMETITTAPSVLYKVFLKDGRELEISNPLDMPVMHNIDHIQEPWSAVTVITPLEYIGNILTLLAERRGVQHSVTYAQNSVILVYDMPLSELVNDFYDCLKSSSRGYASFDYEAKEYRPGKIVKLDILLNGETADALSHLLHESRAQAAGNTMCEQLKKSIPRHQFKVIIQAAVGTKIISRETISPYRKDVTAKCYGGDVTRKRKLLEKQKEGKSRLKSVGRVKLPQDIFQVMVPKN